MDDVCEKSPYKNGLHKWKSTYGVFKVMNREDPIIVTDTTGELTEYCWYCRAVRKVNSEDL